MHGTKRTKPGLSAIRKAVMVLVLGGGCSPQCSVPASSDGDAGACLACDGGTVSVCYNRCLPVVSTGGLCLVDPCGTTTGPTGAGVCGGAVDDGGQHKPLRCVPDSDAGMESNVGHCEEGALGELQMGCTNDSDCDHGTKCVTGTCSYPSGSQTLTLTGFCRHGSGEGAACSADNPCLACAPGLTCVGGHCVRACVPSAAVGTVGACACAGESCVSTNNGGVCCPPGSNAVCRGACTNTMVDVGNCGGCGTVATVAHGVARCVGGRPAVESCDRGYCLANGNGVTVCVDDQTSAENCGSCGYRCTTAGGGSGACVGGHCGCATAGFTDCPGRGCVDLQSDAMDCGACGRTCAAGQTCTSGVCSGASACQMLEMPCSPRTDGIPAVNLQGNCCDNSFCGVSTGLCTCYSEGLHPDISTTNSPGRVAFNYGCCEGLRLGHVGSQYVCTAHCGTCYDGSACCVDDGTCQNATGRCGYGTNETSMPGQTCRSIYGSTVTVNWCPGNATVHAGPCPPPGGSNVCPR